MENARLKKACEDGIDLYDVLKFNTREVSSYQLRERFRQLTLKYHLDKSPIDKETADDFYLKSLAINILSDDKLRGTYDMWWDQWTVLRKQKDQRTRGIMELRKRETKDTGENPDINTATKDLESIQRYGTYLRKLRHFNLPYNWSHKSFEEQPFWDSSTLRLEIDANDSEISNKVCESQFLRSYLESLFDTPINSVYYSSRNRQEDAVIVAYAVFQSPADSSMVYKRYKKWTLPFPVRSIQPRIPIGYYKHHVETPLRATIQSLITKRNEEID